MPVVHGAGTHWSKFWVHPSILVLSLALSLAACQKDDSDSSDEAATPESSEISSASDDSLETASGDAPPADSSSTASSQSWKDRFFGGDDSEEDDEAPAIPVETAIVSPRDIPAYLSSTATLEPEKQADVIAKIDGTVLHIRVEEGDWVTQGQVLAELDGAASAVELEEATARVRGLHLDLERIEGLTQRDLSSEKALNDAQAAYEQAEAQRKGAELRHRYTRIRAAFGGIVSRRVVDLGQHVSTGTVMFTIVDSSPLLARIYLPEREVLAFAPQQRLWIEVDTDMDAEDKIPGSVLRIAPIVDTRTGTVKVTCQVGSDTAGGDKESPLRPGSFVRVLIQTGIHEQVLTVPKRAIVPEGADTYVYLAQADSVVKVPVLTGFGDTKFVEIIEGLNADDRIVTVGHGGLENGSRIDDLTSGSQSPEPQSFPSTDTAATVQ